MRTSLVSIADYEVVRFLGHANRGQLFLARPPQRLGLDDEHVVVKVMTGASAAAFDHLVRELRLFTSVPSPYLATLFDAGEHDDVCFYSMAYYPAGSLEHPCQPLAASVAVRAVADAARGAHALHDAGVAHCDIRPATVLLHDGGGRLSDLGMARATEAGQSVSSMVDISSVSYVDPRLLLGEGPDRASDIYSLGATLHYALTGMGPFPPPSQSEPLLAVRRILGHPPRIDPDLPPLVARLLAACLNADVHSRPCHCGRAGGPGPRAGGDAVTSLAAPSDGGVDHFRIVTLRSGHDDVARTPLPVVADHEARDVDSGVIVRGLYCGRDHFNDPRARYCRTCGLAMAQSKFRFARRHPAAARPAGVRLGREPPRVG